MVDDQALSIYEVGHGPVAEVPPVAKFMKATSSTLAFEWSSNDFSDVNADIATPYTIALYADEACSDLVVSWDIDANQMAYPAESKSFTARTRLASCSPALIRLRLTG